MHMYDIEMLHSAGGHQGSRKAHQAGNQKSLLVGAAPTGDAPTTSEWSTILLLRCDLYQIFFNCK